jgi:hypothetical protein
MDELESKMSNLKNTLKMDLETGEMEASAKEGMRC